MAGPIKAGGAGSIAAAVGSGKGSKLAQAGFSNERSTDARKKLEKGTASESPEQQMARCKDFEEAIEVLRVHYEHYFLGLVRQEPNRERDLLRKEIIRFKSSFIRNAAVKFRTATMHNRYLSYERMWLRTVQEIEDGTYRRDVFKAKLHKKDHKNEQAEAELNAKKLAELTEKVKKSADDFDIAEDPGFEEEPEPPPVAPVRAPIAAAPITSPALAVAPAQARPVAGPPATNPGAVAVKPAVAAAPAVGAPRPAGMPAQAPRTGSGGLTDDKVKAIFDAYVMAKRHCKESTQGLTYDTLASTLRKQMPGLLDKHKAKAIDFKVVIKGGKAILKAVPK